MLDIDQGMHTRNQPLNLNISQNAQCAIPFVTPTPSLLLGDFFGNADHETGLDFDDLVLLVLGDNFITTSSWTRYAKTLLNIAQFLRFLLQARSEEVVVTLSLPATGSNLEEVVSKATMVLPARHCRQVAERTINDGHVNSIRQEARRYAAQGTTVDPNFALHTQLLSQKAIHSHDILFQILGRRFARGPAIGAIIPREYINVLVEEHFYVVSVR